MAGHNWLALTTQKSLYNFHVLVDDSSKRNIAHSRNVVFCTQRVFGLDFLRASDQCFSWRRVTIGDSIELFAIVTSPSPFNPEELDFLLKAVD